jgi:hypothetical protein
VTRLDDAGVDGADRDLEDTLAFGDEVRELVGGLGRGVLFVHGVAPGASWAENGSCADVSGKKGR